DPGGRGRAGDRQQSVGEMAPAGDRQAEVQCGAGDPVGGFGWSPGPQLATGRGQFDAYRRGSPGYSPRFCWVRPVVHADLAAAEILGTSSSCTICTSRMELLGGLNQW